MIYQCTTKYKTKQILYGMLYDDETKTLIIKKEFDAERSDIYFTEDSGYMMSANLRNSHICILIKTDGEPQYKLLTQEMIEDVNISEKNKYIRVARGMLFCKGKAICILKKRIKGSKLDLRTTGELAEIKEEFGMVRLFSKILSGSGSDGIETIVCDNRTGSVIFLEVENMKNLKRVIMENHKGENYNGKGIWFRFSEEQKKTVTIFCEGEPELYKFAKDFDMNHVMETVYADKTGKIKNLI